jgi:hypothetical protein
MTEYLLNWIYCDTLNVYVQPERKVHGLGCLPKGYILAYVPIDAVMAFKWDEDPPTPEISGEISWSIQLFFSKTWDLIKMTGTAITAWFRALTEVPHQSTLRTKTRLNAFHHHHKMRDIYTKTLRINKVMAVI